MQVSVADVDAVVEGRLRPVVAWVCSAERRLALAVAQVGLELRLASGKPALLDILDLSSQPSLLNDAPRLTLAPFVAESVYAPLIAGIVVIDPVLAEHSRVIPPAELAEPVNSRSEPGADFGRVEQAVLHDVLDLCQALEDRDVLTVPASAVSLTGQHPSSLLLPL
jgi:hypothetical protein